MPSEKCEMAFSFCPGFNSRSTRQKEKAISHFSDGKLNRVLDFPVARRENMDGIKLYLGEAGWVMVRASGTENVLRIYSETGKPETTRRVLANVSDLVQSL